MGILNITPDSFSDGGKFLNTKQAIQHALKMEQDGADIIDIGGESTRPGATPVTLEEELRRVLPVIKVLVKKLAIPISIDTIKAEVAQKTVDLGVSIVNDTSGLSNPKIISVVSQSSAGVVIMHAQGTPQTMQKNPQYKNIIKEVYHFFECRIKQAIDCGISKTRIVVDPGIGFGKTVDHNLTLINRLSDFLPLGVPILLGPSRKSFISKVLSDTKNISNAIHQGTAIAVSTAIMNGARIVRVHDVESIKITLQMTEAILKMKI